MKKLVLLGAVAIVALSSCKKDYTCTYEVDADTSFSIDCLKCSSDDIEAIESVSYTVNGKDYGYDCVKK